MSDDYSVDEEVRVAQQFLGRCTLPEDVRIVARPGKADGVMVVQLTCHGPEGTRSVRHDPLGAWSSADDAAKSAMIARLLADLAPVT